MKRNLNFAPSWIVEEVFQTELQFNWHEAFETVNEETVSRSANVISSHVIYSIKCQENGAKTLKARIVPDGNRDVEKHNIRKDSSTAQFDIIRILFMDVSLLGFRLGMADIEGAYLQSGPIRRTIYVRPPSEWQGPRGTLWKLK